MKYLLITLIFFTTINAQSKSIAYSSYNTEDLHLTYGVLTEMRLPAAATSTFISQEGIVQFIEVPGTNKLIYLLKVLVAPQSEDDSFFLNIRIFTEEKSYNIKTVINDPSEDKVTTLYNLRSKSNSSIDNISFSRTAKTKHTKKEIELSKFSIDSLKKNYSSFFDDVKNPIVSHKDDRVILAIEHINFVEGKIVFFMKLSNSNPLPYDIKSIKLRYNEYESVAYVSKRQTKNKQLNPVYVEYQKESVKEDESTHIIFVIDKVGVKSDGQFTINVKEKKGQRHFELEMPSLVKG